MLMVPSVSTLDAPAVEPFRETAFFFEGIGLRLELAVQQVDAEVQERKRAVGGENRREVLGRHG